VNSRGSAATSKVLALGYRLQEIERGGLGESTRRKLQTIEALFGIDVSTATVRKFGLDDPGVMPVTVPEVRLVIAVPVN
jgi:hypothetical protein